MSLHHFSRSTLKSCLVGAAALGSVALMPAPEAKAACLTSIADNTNCSTFESSTDSVVITQYTDTGFINNADIDRLGFFVSGFTAGVPITLTGIEYSLDGGANYVTTGLSSTSYTIEPFYTSFTAPNAFTSFISLDLTDFRLKYTIPASATLSPNGESIRSVIENDGAGGLQLQTRVSTLNNSNDPDPVPGPLSVLGAGAAFAFTRKIRRRIDLAN